MFPLYMTALRCADSPAGPTRLKDTIAPAMARRGLFGGDGFMSNGSALRITPAQNGVEASTPVSNVGGSRLQGGRSRPGMCGGKSIGRQ